MKVWKDDPKGLKAWRRRALARRRAMIKANPDKIVWDDYELPYIPSEDTVSFSYNEWRSAWSGAIQ